MENNRQEVPIDCLILIAKHFGTTVNEVIYFGEKNNIPQEISVEEKATLEQLQLINEQDKEEKTILLKLIETGNEAAGACPVLSDNAAAQSPA